MKLDDLAEIIEKHRNGIVDFGDSLSEIVPTDERISETESILGIKLPPSYIWFLKNYGGGTVFGDEIYSVSKTYSENNMFDVASKTITDRQAGLLEDSEVAICSTDFGEQFLMDTSKVNEQGEYPIVRKTGDTRKIVAHNFADFLRCYINEELS